MPTDGARGVRRAARIFLCWLSYINTAMVPMREKQTARLPPCFFPRYVSVAFGVKNASHVRGVLVHAHSAPKSDFRHGAYAAFAWAKWLVLRDALLTARMALWLDADAVLFQNPFAPFLGRELYEAELLAYDLRFAPELACGGVRCRAHRPPVSLAGLGGGATTCALNTGVVFAGSRRLVEAVLAKLPADLDEAAKARAAGWIDQDTADAVLRAGNYSWCPLPTAQYVNHCWWAWGSNRGNRTLFDNLRRCGLVSFHASCLANANSKMAAVSRMLRKTESCAEEDHSRLGSWGPRAAPWESRMEMRARGRAPARRRSTGRA